MARALIPTMAEWTINGRTTDSSSLREGHPRNRALDGLRAIAVVSVMVFHHDGRWLPGGYLGVDVFFVLSGYLITSLLLTEYTTAGVVHLRKFWTRRLRRLLPALAVMTVLLAAFARWGASISQHQRIRQGAFATALFVKNYWDITNERLTTPGHTWSLAVEMQFYLLWPILLVLLLRLQRRWRHSVVAGICLLTLASVVTMANETAWNAAQTSLESRAQSLLVGCFLAVALPGIAEALGGAALRVYDLVGVGALVFVLGVMWRADDTAAGWLNAGGSLLIAVSVAVIIASLAVPDRGWLRRALSSRPFVAIGKRSYGLYLFHIPVYLWVTSELTGMRGVPLFGLRLLIVGAITVLSYQWIEQPAQGARFRGLLSKGVIACAVVVPLALVTAATATSLRLPAGMTRQMYDEWEFMRLTTERHQRRVLIVGDALASSMQQWRPNGYNGKRIQGVSAAVPECGIAEGALVIGKARAPMSPRCHDVADWYSSVVEAFQPKDVVVMVGVTDVFDHEVDGKLLSVGSREYEQYLVARLDTLRASLTRDGARMLIATLPCTGQQPDDVRLLVSTRLRSDLRRVVWLTDVFRRYAAERRAERVSIVDVRSVLCNGVAPRVDKKGQAFIDPVSSLVATRGAQAVWLSLDVERH